MQRTFTRTYRFNLLVAVICACLFLQIGAAESRGKSRAGLTRVQYHGWEAIVLRNASSELVLVPEIGRVMEFNLIDDRGQVIEGPFWKNPALNKNLAADVEGWKNFGGDKAWPAEQADWLKIVGRGWPPPIGFDATPFTAEINRKTVDLVSPVDRVYGIRVHRIIALDEKKPQARIRTVFEKVQGPPVRVAVWTITQLKTPERGFILLPAYADPKSPYADLFPSPARNVKVEGRLLSITRDLEKGAKVGTGGNAILWVGDGPDLLLETKAPEVEHIADWPEKGSRTEIYTNPGEELKYVEFELLDRMHALRIGQKESLDAVYTLIPRVEKEAGAEAKRVFRLR